MKIFRKLDILSLSDEHTFEFSSILSTVNLSKHSITTWITQKFIQLVNSVTFSDFFFVFGNQVWLNLYERALSGNELFPYKVAENSFQYFSRLRVWLVIITTLYLLTPASWNQQTAQSSGNKLLLILWHNRLPYQQYDLLKTPLILALSAYNWKTNSVTPIFCYRIVISMIRCNFLQILKRSAKGVQCHLKFSKS